MATKSTFALQLTGSEAENAMRKMVFAAAIGMAEYGVFFRTEVFLDSTCSFFWTYYKAVRGGEEESGGHVL